METVVTKASLVAEIQTLRLKQARMPAHWIARREQIGAQIDELVQEWLDMV